MKYITLGRSGLRVSRICLGTMTFGNDWGFGADQESSNGIIDAYLDHGGNFLDTANMYNNGHAEAIVGDYFIDRGGRERTVVATKFSANLDPGNVNAGGASRAAIVAACEQSLRRLKTDYIDLYWMHWWDKFTPIEETMRALDDLVRAGKVRYIGFSDTPAWKVAQAQTIATVRGWEPLVALQLEYSLLERTVEFEMLPVAQELGLGVTPWSPLRAGVLSGKYRKGVVVESTRAGLDRKLDDHAWRVLEVLERAAEETGTTMARAAIAWLLHQPSVSSVIIGARTHEQFLDNIGVEDVVLNDVALAELDQASRVTPIFPWAFLQSSWSASYGGLSINGESFPPTYLPDNGRARY